MSLEELLSSLRRDLSQSQAPARTNLHSVKRELLNQHLLIPGSRGQQPSRTQLQAAADILEISALLSIRSLQFAQFESFLSLLTAFEALPISDLRPQLIALHLLLLLSRNEIGTFHTQIERLTASHPEVMQRPEVSYVVEMERCLMEGSYSKVWQRRQNPPMPEFKPLLDALMSTIRNEIASCGEKAYTVLPIADAATLLFFTEIKDLMEFAQQRSGWTIHPTSQTISFGALHSQPLYAIEALDKTLIMENALTYARELETIV